jgi:glycosyltransferase involved in cell wall biosynthesis
MAVSAHATEPAPPLLARAARFIGRRVHDAAMKIRRPERSSIRQAPWPAELPLVSVIVPCFNYGRFVDEAVRSVLAQTFERFEIIVIDDGSTDPPTRATLAAMRYARTRVIYQVNQGLAATRNNGAALARGKYLCYLDADDSFEPSYLEKMLVELERDETLGACFSWVQCFGDCRTVWKTRSLDPYYLRQSTTAPSHSVIRKTAWERVRAANGAGFLGKYNGYFEDWVFWIDMLACGYRGQAVAEPLIRYRVHANSLGATHRAGFAAMLETLHRDRARFFGSAAYRRQLARRLNRRVHVENPEIASVPRPAAAHGARVG